jgi:hypothetical protein
VAVNPSLSKPESLPTFIRRDDLPDLIAGSLAGTIGPAGTPTPFTMVTIQQFREWALSFPGAVELPHFDRISFRLGKKIFATYWAKEDLAMLKLSMIDQDVFCVFKPQWIYPVPGTWGEKGATYFRLGKMRKDLFQAALKQAYLLLQAKK